jgi:hypothetical protein
MVSPLIETPIAFLIFNRPDTTLKVFKEIEKARPRKLLVVADGPRTYKSGEAEQCIATRAIIDQISWDCEVLTNYSEVNLGCRKRISSGLDWIFNTVEEAIILEDDCLPHPTFFRYCEELLEYYRDDQRVMHISGDNFQYGHKRTKDSYYFSQYTHVWGWASWRRAWQNYDVEMKSWQTVKDGKWLADILKDRESILYWENTFQSVYDGKADSWSNQWLFACWLQSGLSILPNVNLVSNIGFGIDATHTTRKSELANIPTEAMDFPLQHPLLTLRDTQADELTRKAQFRTSSLLGRVKKRVNKIFSTVPGVT